MENLTFRVAFKRGDQYAYSFFNLTEEGGIEFDSTYGEVGGIFKHRPTDKKIKVWFYEKGSHWMKPKFAKMQSVTIE